MKASKIISYLLSLLLLVTSPAGFAQNGVFQPKSNKVQYTLTGNYRTDTAQLKSVIIKALSLADQAPDSAIHMLYGIPELCHDIDFYHGEADANNALGNALQTKGEFEQAKIMYENAYELAVESGYKKGLPSILGNIALVNLNQGNYPVALQKFYESLSAAEAVKDRIVIRNTYNNIGTIHFYQEKFDEAEMAYRKTLDMSIMLRDTPNIVLAYNNLGEVNLEKHNTKQAIGNLSHAYELAKKIDNQYMLVAVSNTIGDTYLLIDSVIQAKGYFENALILSEQNANARAACKAMIGLAKVNSKLGNLKIAERNALDALTKARAMGQVQLQRDALQITADIYEQLGIGNKAIKYYREYKLFSDSLVNLESERAAANYKAEYNFSKKEQEFQRQTLQQRWMIVLAGAGLIFLLFIVWLISRNRKKLGLTNKDLEQKNAVIEKQKKLVEENLQQLKVTQSQLVHAEKMASLGELIAGIAHEIQNPLNFVNNFSEVSVELLVEMRDEIDNHNFEDAKELAADVSGNLTKIIHHGKRADAIVKGMLQHSRTSTTQKEIVDINALCDEYVRLSYHGLKAKDKSFNATIKTDFDPLLRKINVIPQDLGRVILNLLTNAFYAVDEKRKTLLAVSEKTTFQPTVSIKTKQGTDSIEIIISDNGNGIPESAIDKIFNPFFTTKPPGEGTGLGLSMSYDIITKGHTGALKVQTKAGEGTDFIIYLSNEQVV